MATVSLELIEASQLVMSSQSWTRPRWMMCTTPRPGGAATARPAVLAADAAGALVAGSAVSAVTNPAVMALAERLRSRRFSILSSTRGVLRNRRCGHDRVLPQVLAPD